MIENMKDVIEAAKAKADLVNSALRDTRYNRAALQVQISELATTEKEIVGAITRALKAQEKDVAPVTTTTTTTATPAPAAKASKATKASNPAREALASADLLAVVG